MAETPVAITVGNGTASVAADLVSGNVYQQIKVVDGTLGSNTALKVNADGSITASIYGNISVTPPTNQSVSGTVVTLSQGSIAAVIIGGSIAATFTPPANQSVSGTLGASIIGTVPVTGNFTSSFTQPSSLVAGVTSVITGTASVILLNTAPTGQRNYITNILVTNAAAVATQVSLIDAGLPIYTGWAAANGGGFSASFPTALRQSSIAGSLGVVSSVQASVFVSASGYTAT